jgi:hypothetical protein
MAGAAYGVYDRLKNKPSASTTVQRPTPTLNPPK